MNSDSINVPIPRMKDLILRNLWHYQRRHHGTTEFSNRWTFSFKEEHPLYPYFLAAVFILKREGLVSETNDGQCFLTDFGIEKCRNEGLELDRRDRFFEDFGID